MILIKFTKAIRDAYREANAIHFPRLDYKVKAFIILSKLHFKCNTGYAKKPVESENVLGFRVSASTYEDLLMLFREIAVKLQYHFSTTKVSPRIIDGGAHIGMTVLLYKLLYPRSIILAFEPDPENYKLLVKNLEANKIRNVRTYNSALSASASTTDFFRGDGSFYGSLISTDSDQNKINVQSVRLSSILLDADYDMVKLDAEGSELEIVNELIETKTIGSSNQYLIACHRSKNIDSSVLVQSMANAGFSHKQRQPHYKASQREIQDDLIAFQNAT